VNRLLTRDPASGAELVVTRLWCPLSGVTIEGEFGLGWIAKLSPEQLDFVGLLLRSRNNLQRLATELGVSYSTARSRLDEIVAALGGQVDDGEEPPDTRQPGGAATTVATGRGAERPGNDLADAKAEPAGGGPARHGGPPRPRIAPGGRLSTLEALAAGEITHEEALRRLRG